MTFIEESGRRSKVYDFTTLPVGPELQRWMAQVFADTTGPRGRAKRVSTAEHYYGALRKFAAVLTSVDSPPTVPGDIIPAHVAAFRLALAPGSFNAQIQRLRTLVRHDTELHAQTRSAIAEGRLPRRPLPTIRAYTDDDRQQILTAARGDIRRARERIRAGQELLARYRRGEPDRRSQEERIGRVLDVLDLTGELPRLPCGQIPDSVQALGGVRVLLPMLCLTRMEATAFAVLLVDMTGENFGTVIDWPAVHFRPDGGFGEPAVALVEETKPRRGPAREHMVVAVEDLPAGLAGILDGDSEERRLFRSPLRVYLLLLELSALARRHGGLTRAFSYVGMSVGRNHDRWLSSMRSYYVGCWGERHGFPRPPGRRPDQSCKDRTALNPQPTAGQVKPNVSTQRLRQTAIERHRRPVAHSRATMNDYYLRRSPQVAAESRDIVREALNDEVSKARAVQTVPVFTPGFLDRAQSDSAGAAAEMGVDIDTLTRILAREQDTVVASCVDHRDSPYTEPGTPCDASFLQCLLCPNARALPHQLPIQVATHDRLAALRTNLNPQTWDRRYAEPFARLTDLLGHYSVEDRDTARHRLSPEDRQLLDDLMNGRLDLR
ncbi:hypothetical protein JWS13_03515 (plasmid) [Rhodococcus pseudokoreensis]|uniref:Core-binding (CB) domain-containing protein n=1 Tax=Rhodococcus pseudokoreensis TaxID=2811421 RepID=A0A974VZ45_9NOCA|nr:hypothetical protein JWS13_03515 [Rhodococcus pseudokoreensis]